MTDYLSFSLLVYIGWIVHTSNILLYRYIVELLFINYINPRAVIDNHVKNVVICGAK